MKISNDSTLFSKAYHFFCVVLFAYFHEWDRKTSSYSFFLNLLFLTCITFYSTWLYFILSFLNDMGILSYFNKSRLDKLFNMVIAFSLTTFIIYWILYLKHPNTITKENVEVPFILNLFYHGGVYIVNLLEQSIFNPRVTDNRLSKKFFVIFLAIYSIFLKVTYLSTGYIIYPFVAKPIINFLLTVIFANILTLTGNQIYVSLSSPDPMRSRM